MYFSVAVETRVAPILEGDWAAAGMISTLVGPDNRTGIVEADASGGSCAHPTAVAPCGMVLWMVPHEIIGFEPPLDSASVVAGTSHIGEIVIVSDHGIKPSGTTAVVTLGGRVLVD
jgi:hypothetical protein